MTTTVMEEYILPTLTRYIDDHNWSFNLAKRLINQYYGADYTEKEVRKLYRKSKT